MGRSLSRRDRADRVISVKPNQQQRVTQQGRAREPAVHDRFDYPMTRRKFARVAAATGAYFTVPGLFAEQLALTPYAAEGPYYPDKLPLDADNDLIVVNDSATPALGEIAHVTGRVLTNAGEPVRNATVEIWQVDAKGIYLHSRAPRVEERDSNFQGFGRFETGSTGEYRFRTIKPVDYVTGGRVPHIHYAVNLNGHRVLTTQLFLKGHQGNENDGVIRSARRAGSIDSLFVEFKPVPGSKIGELATSFDLVIDGNPDEKVSGSNGRGTFRGGRFGRFRRRG